MNREKDNSLIKAKAIYGDKDIEKEIEKRKKEIYKNVYDTIRFEILEEIIEKVGKKRHYDLEEYDHDSKMMSVGYNKCLDDILELLKQ